MTKEKAIMLLNELSDYDYQFCKSDDNLCAYESLPIDDNFCHLQHRDKNGFLTGKNNYKGIDWIDFWDKVPVHTDITFGKTFSDVVIWGVYEIGECQTQITDEMYPSLYNFIINLTDELLRELNSNNIEGYLTVENDMVFLNTYIDFSVVVYSYVSDIRTYMQYPIE